MRIERLTEQHALEIAEWRYEFPYEWYDTASDPRRIELFAKPVHRDQFQPQIEFGQIENFYRKRFPGRIFCPQAIRLLPYLFLWIVWRIEFSRIIQGR